MKIKYPPTCTTAEEKTAFLYRLYELLRLRHNEQGARFKAKEINKQEWDEFLQWFDKRHELFVSDLLLARKQLKEDEDVVIDVDTVFEE